MLRLDEPISQFVVSGLAYPIPAAKFQPPRRDHLANFYKGGCAEEKSSEKIRVRDIP